MGIFIGARFKAKAHRLIAQAVPIFQHQQLFTGQSDIGTHSRFAHG